MNKMKLPEGSIFEVGKKENKSDINNNTDITTDSKVNSSDIIIEFDESIERTHVAVLLRLKPATVKALDDIAWQTRQSRNSIAQTLLDKAIANVKIKKK